MSINILSKIRKAPLQTDRRWSKSKRSSETHSARLATKKSDIEETALELPLEGCEGFCNIPFPWEVQPAKQRLNGSLGFFPCEGFLNYYRWAKFGSLEVQSVGFASSVATKSWSYNHCCDKKKGNVKDVSKKQISNCSSTTLMQTETFLTVILPKLRRVFFASHTRGILRVLESLWDEDPPEVFRVEFLEGWIIPGRVHGYMGLWMGPPPIKKSQGHFRKGSHNPILRGRKLTMVIDQLLNEMIPQV